MTGTAVHVADGIRSLTSGLRPELDHRNALLKLATALSVAAAGNVGVPDIDEERAEWSDTGARNLSGIWRSRYEYRSSSRDGDLHGEHRVVLRQQGRRLTGQSMPHAGG